MKWFKRFCWIATWGVWLWLGCGLHRELPRDLGPVACKLHLETGTAILGFVGDSSNIALLEYLQADEEYGVVIYDGNTGAFVSKSTFPLSALIHLPRHASRHGAFFAYLKPDPEKGQPEWGLHALDIAEGRWRFVTEQRVRDLSVHPEKPWVMYVEEFKPHRWTQRVVVFDVREGKSVFVAEETLIRQQGQTFFIPGGERIVVPSGEMATTLISDEVVGYDVWDLAGNPKRIQSLNTRSLGRLVDASSGGFAFILPSSANVTTIYDVNAESEVLSLESELPPAPLAPPLGAVAGKRPAPVAPKALPPANRLMPITGTQSTFSRSGKTATGGSPVRLWNLETKAPIWSESTFQTWLPTTSNEQFASHEIWHVLWQRWFPNVKFETRALRAIDDGRLVYRTTSTEMPAPQNQNVSGTLAYCGDGTVFRMPAKVNWALLTLCQTILALPLVLLWTVLRWRRKRKQTS